MDPDATLKLLIDYFVNGDWESALEAAEDLANWLAESGFKPKHPLLAADATIEQLGLSRDHWRRMAKHVLGDEGEKLYVTGMFDEHEFDHQQPPHHGFVAYGPYGSCLEAVGVARTLSSDPDEAVVLELVWRDPS